MDNTPKQPDWNQIRAFLTTAETGSLSAAARSLGLTQPTLSRQVSALEKELGLLLFERIGRSLELTQAGLELLEHTRAMGDAANRMTLTASGQIQSIDGEVRITATDILSVHYLPAFLKDLFKEAPNLKVDVVAVNDIRDLMRREADIAIRHVRPTQPDLIAKLVVEASGNFYASKGYIQKHGMPRSKADLSQHKFVSFGDTAQMISFMQNIDVKLDESNFSLGSENGLVAWQFALEGFGICVMDELYAETHSEMVRLLPKSQSVKFPIWLATHRELHTSRRIRLVFDMLAAHLSTTYKSKRTENDPV